MGPLSVRSWANRKARCIPPLFDAQRPRLQPCCQGADKTWDYTGLGGPCREVPWVSQAWGFGSRPVQGDRAPSRQSLVSCLIATDNPRE